MRTWIRKTLANLQAINPSKLDFQDIGIVINDSDTDLNGMYHLAYGANAGSGLKSDDSNWVRTSRVNRTYLPADVANSATDTLADVTSLSFPMVSGRTYKFKVFVVYSADATTSGSRWTVNCATAPTALFYRSNYSLTTTADTLNTGLGARQLPAAANATSAATTGNTAIIEGIITAGATEALIVQSAAEAGTITAKANWSYIEWEQIHGVQSAT